MQHPLIVSCVSNRIRALREARGLSLEALAHLAGTTNQQISHLEAGRRRLTVDWLCRLGQALACHPWALVSEEPPGTLLPQELRLLQAFRQLPSPQREALLTLVAPSAAPRRRPARQPA
jgi:transcriptional regulator with XRE-family HTH domain